jgi:hypothetical protein
VTLSSVVGWEVSSAGAVSCARTAGAASKLNAIARLKPLCCNVTRFIAIPSEDVAKPDAAACADETAAAASLGTRCAGGTCTFGQWAGGRRLADTACVAVNPAVIPA